jgi:hypothetical protein
MPNRNFLAIALITLLGSVSAGRAAQSTSSQHQHEQSMPEDKGTLADQNHYEDVNKHGDMAMGFSHRKTTHHFRLTASGGFIQVQANDPKDTTSRAQVRVHLQHISKAFKDGDFSDPEMTHSRVPPGVPTMQQLKFAIEYKYVETKAGGKVLISTLNPEALKAVHEFLRFQIEDHQTGDPKTVQK